MNDRTERRLILEKAEELNRTLRETWQRLQETPCDEESRALRETTQALFREMQRMEKNLRNMAELSEKLPPQAGEDEGGEQDGNH